MKKRNQYRASGEEKVKTLVSGLSYSQRIKALLISQQRWVYARRLALILLLIIGGIYGIQRIYHLGFEQSQKLKIEHIDFNSYGILSQEKTLELLGIETDLRVTHLDTAELTKKLQAHPLVREAQIYTELPSTLHIKIKEHLPIAYIRQKTELKGDIYFIDPKGTIFPVNAQYHQDYLNSPIWYIEETDTAQFKIGGQLNEQSYKPIIELLTAINGYELSEIPRVREIYRPKEWKIVMSLETGCQVVMKSFEIEQQVKRLREVLEHARMSNRQLRSVNVIPEKNPAVVFF